MSSNARLASDRLCVLLAASMCVTRANRAVCTLVFFSDLIESM